MRLGKINFADLALLLWKSNDHFLPFQDFLKDYLVTVYKEQHRVGVISGCNMTAPAGLTVRVSAGVVLFDNDELVKVEQTDVVLDVADAADPRLDRMELIYSLANNSQVTNTINQVKQFDKLETGTPTKNTGVPNAVPVLQVTTAGAISVGSISVAATQTVLTAADLSEKETVRDISRPVDNLATEEDILNNQAGTDVPLMIADKTKHRQKTWKYQVKRKTDTGASGVVNAGELIALLNPETLDWEITDEQKGEDEIGIDFLIDAATGQISYDSTNIAGANYVGKISYTTETLDI